MTIQLPKTTYQNILIMLSMLNHRFEDKNIDVASYTSQPRIKKLLHLLSERAYGNTGMDDISPTIQINSEEAGEILRACWDTKMLCYCVDGDYQEGFSSRQLRTTLNDIAAALGSIAEL